MNLGTVRLVATVEAVMPHDVATEGKIALRSANMIKKSFQSTDKKGRQEK